MRRRNAFALLPVLFGLCLSFLSPLSARAQRGFGLRMGSEEQDLSRYREYNFNVAVLGDPTELTTYSDYAPEALPPDSPLRVRVEENRRQMRERLRRARQSGLGVCLYTDEIKLPTALMRHLGTRITRDDDPRRVDLEKEEFWNVYRAKYREVLKDFPEIDYIMVRTGENYSFLTDGYTGQLVAANEPRGRRTETFYRNMQRLIEETRRVVVGEFGKKLIWRTWSLGNYGFHSSPEVYERVLAGVKNRDGLIFSVKFTQTDFWRYNDFNPNIGRGGADQIVEFQCAREYEGKGAYPDYVGEEHAAAMRRARASGNVRGVWLWDFGGGWNGPYLKSDRWVRLNIYATARLAEDPWLSARARRAHVPRGARHSRLQRSPRPRDVTLRAGHVPLLPLEGDERRGGGAARAESTAQVAGGVARLRDGNPEARRRRDPLPLRVLFRQRPARARHVRRDVGHGRGRAGRTGPVAPRNTVNGL